VPSLMEVTYALSNCASAAQFDFGEDTAIVAVQHMLWQTIDLFEAVAALGAKRENIFALGKVYSNSPLVIGALRDRRITVVQSTTPEPGEFDKSFQHDVDRLWEAVVRGIADRKIQRILVLDDGGRCIASIPPELLRQYAVSGVEQTSHGMFLFEEKPPPFAVMSWARAAVKLQIGGPLFSHCLLMKLQSHFLGGNRLTGEDVGIIGMGSIGTAMAHLIARQHNHVIFYDPDPSLHGSPNVQGRVTRVDSLEELLSRCEYVVGCSGRHPFKGQWPLKHRPGIKLFSGSGGDHEFGPIIHDLKTKRDFNVTSLTWDIESASGPSGPILIAYLGYPYNFVSRDVEAVPTSVVQVETGGLLAGLIQAHIHLRLCEEGRAKNRGLHRISPEAQHFVCETWLTAMKSHGIDLEQVYGYDPARLEAARSLSWLAANSEPRPSSTYEPNHDIEAAMARIVEARARHNVGSNG
jgi:hypothetical protein